jgi:hypothetical protein
MAKPDGIMTYDGGYYIASLHDLSIACWIQRDRTTFT